MSRKPITKISDALVLEALQVVRNYCNQSVGKCSECYLRMDDKTCLFRAELLERFDKWKKERVG